VAEGVDELRLTVGVQVAVKTAHVEAARPVEKGVPPERGFISLALVAVRMQRRQYLAIGAVSVATVTTGCIGGGSSSEAEEPLSFEEPYQNEDDVRVTVQRIEFQEQIEWTDNADQQRVEEPEAGEKWALLYVHAENDGDRELLLPWGDDFVLKAPGMVYEEARVEKTENHYVGGEAAPGVTREGWIAYTVDETLERNEITVELYAERGGDLSTRWKP
jgi:hypothetical protein